MWVSYVSDTCCVQTWNIVEGEIILTMLSNNSIWDMSCFLRESVLLCKEQRGTVDMANRRKFVSILTIYIKQSTWTEETDTIRMVYSMVAPEYMITSYKESQN